MLDGLRLDSVPILLKEMPAKGMAEGIGMITLEMSMKNRHW